MKVRSDRDGRISRENPKTHFMVLGVGVNAGRFHDSEPQHYGTAILVRGGHRTPLGHIKTFPEFSSLNTDFPRDHLITHATIISLSVQSAFEEFCPGSWQLGSYLSTCTNGS